MQGGRLLLQLCGLGFGRIRFFCFSLLEQTSDLFRQLIGLGKLAVKLSLCRLSPVVQGNDLIDCLRGRNPSHRKPINDILPVLLYVCGL